MPESGSLNLVTLKYGTEYPKTKDLVEVETEYTREIEDMEESLGKHHTVVRILKSIKAMLLLHMGKYGLARAIEHELKEDL